jgi:hypothetical protein
MFQKVETRPGVFHCCLFQAAQDGDNPPHQLLCFSLDPSSSPFTFLQCLVAKNKVPRQNTLIYNGGYIFIR